MSQYDKNKKPNELVEALELVGADEFIVQKDGESFVSKVKRQNTGLLTSSDIANFETTTELNARDVANRARANHTGTQLASTISDFDTTVEANTEVSANTSARHTHTNKALLDTYTQTEVNLADAVAKKHEHANKALLDTYTQTEVDLALAVAHKDLTDNPHSVTKTQVGLSNVDNIQQIPLTEKAANNGVATLDAGGKVPATQLPNTIMSYEGIWNANTNTPTLADATVPVHGAGTVYLVTVAGTQDLGSGSQTFAIGDWVVYNGTIWEKSINSNAVVSVNGQQGVVSLDKGDVGLGNVDNTSDANKPVSTAQQTALDLKADDDSVVKLTGNQTIAGVKTFSDNSIFDSNVGIGTSIPVGKLSVSTTGDTNALNVIDATGNVLIGTATDVTAYGGAKLQVIGGASSPSIWTGRIVAGGSSNVFLLGELSGNAQFGAHNTALTKWADVFINSGGGNVKIGGGISGPAPSAKLHIVAAGNTSATTALRVDNSSLSSLLFVRNDGNVGIGTTTPSEKLHVVDGKVLVSGSGAGIQIGGAVLQNGANQFQLNTSAHFSTTGLFAVGTTPVSNFGIKTPYGFDVRTSGEVWMGDSKKIMFGTGQDSSIYYDGSDMYLNSQEVGTGDFIFNGGNVGIGTTTPGNKLSVVVNTADSSERVAGFIRNTNAHNQVRLQLSIAADASTTGLSGMQLFHTTGTAGWANYEARPLSFWTGTSAGTASQRMHIATDGNVGIGTDTPTSKLHVTGAVTQEPLSADPADPADGNSVQWVSDGTGSGDAGDVMMKITVGATTKTITLVDFSAAV